MVANVQRLVDFISHLCIHFGVEKVRAAISGFTRKVHLFGEKDHPPGSKLMFQHDIVPPKR
ncbi:hypothetical protein CTA1_4939 [Colletotrichum tanaceti]|uniref:Uncharacterized protein n=1 Tax=Colletotrichum tanaceti TaxID=1306861 RepID=A0A4V6DIE7_9PEZI|nr:hypothetical protein CTA1_4939 [Colletotrichum tanaceti]